MEPLNQPEHLHALPQVLIWPTPERQAYLCVQGCRHTCVHQSADTLTLLPAPHAGKADFIFGSWEHLGDGEFCHSVGHH